MVEVRMLGNLEVLVEGAPLEPCASGRAWSLLAWLALHPGEHARAAVAARFWPDVLDSSARASLRNAIWTLRQALGPHAQDALIVERERVELAARTDLAEFEDRLAAGDLEGALRLHRGPLLADLDEDWVLEARDAHAERVDVLLARLADLAPTPEAAVGYARRRVALDPLGERAARDLMTRLANAGDRAGALAVYERLRDRLRESFGLAPAVETRAAAEALRSTGAHAPPATAPGAPPLVGRDEEEAALRALWEGVRRGRATVLLISGEAGIGKSRLAAELLAHARADGALVASATATALDLGTGAPLALWSEVVGEITRELVSPDPGAAWPHELAVICPGLPRRLGRRATPPAGALPPEFARARLSEAVVELCEHATSSAPLVLTFEDVHVADAASLELMAYVARRSADLPLMLVLTRRTAPRRIEVDVAVQALRSRPVTVAELELTPLPRSAIDRLVASLANLESPIRDRVVTAADGNPLLAVEGALAASREPYAVSAGLRATVRSAANRLGAGARRVADVAAVAGRDLQRAELAELAAPEDVLAAAECGLLVAEDGRLGFRHALLREAAYADLPDARRRALHEELASALHGPPAERARHLRLAGRDDLAAAQFAAAARHARNVGALREAADFLDEAIALRAGDPEMHLLCGEIAALRGHRAAAHEHHACAVRALGVGDHERLAGAWLRSARWHRAGLCDPRQAGEDARRALAELDAGAVEDAVPRAEAVALLAWVHAITGDTDRTEALLEELRPLVEQLGSPPLLLHDEGVARGHLLLRRARWRESCEAHVQSARWAAVAGRPDMAYAAWINAACAAAADGDFDLALEMTERGLAAVAHAGVLASAVHAARAHVLGRLSRHDEARAALLAQREHAENSGDPALMAQADADAGLVLLAAGEMREGADRLAAALAGGARIRRAEARLRRAEALARLGCAGEAEAELRAAVQEPVAPGDRPSSLVPRMAHVQGLIAHHRGDVELARRRLEESASGWRRQMAGDTGEEYTAHVVDLGRPPVAGLVEPDRELERVLADLRALAAAVT